MPANESDLITQVSGDRLWETNSAIAKWVRLSGSEEEREAVEYIKHTLEGYGLRTTLLEHPALVSYPLESRLEVLDETGKVITQYECLGHAFSASAEALDGELVDMGAGGAAQYSAADVRGKIVLVDGLAGPTAVYAAEQAGALGEVFVNDEHLHNMIVSTVWGTPTPASAERIPVTPAVSIVAGDGRDLRSRLAAGSIRVRIHTRVFKDWQVTPIVIGEIEGKQSDQFVLFSGHQDSWHYGAMDNGSANATMLEVARILSQHRDELYRGLRVIFWSGHSHGRYSGSTWYVDNHWEDLHDHCVAHVNVDSTGARGATYYGSFPAHLELGSFGAGIVQQHTGQQSEARRMSRAGDMSFNGVGIPAMFMSLSQVPIVAEEPGSVAASLSALLGGKMPWWWHTKDDTIDKVDLDVLSLDTRIYVSTLWRLCHEPLLPMDFCPVVDDIEKELATLQQAGGSHLDLSDTQARAGTLAAKAAALAERTANASDADAPALNRQMMALSRILIPITYTLAGQFDHDPAWPVPHVPGLQDVGKLAGLAKDSDEYLFLKTQLVRSHNALRWALRQAIEALE